MRSVSSKYSSVFWCLRNASIASYCYVRGLISEHCSFLIDLGLHSCGFLMKCIVQMAYVFLSVKDCEGIWVMPARFVIAQTSGALFADAVFCWRECHGTHGRSIHFSGRELNVPVPSWDQIGPNCIIRIRLLYSTLPTLWSLICLWLLL